MQPGPRQSDRTVVREPTWAWVLVWAGFPLLGAAAGWLLVAVADRVSDLRWAPLMGLFRLLDRFAGTPVTIGAIALGAVAGLLLALAGHREKLTVSVDPTGVELVRDGTRRQVERAGVAAVFLDGAQLVGQDAAGRELFREKSDLAGADLAAAFTGHGYPWRDGDPHADDFRLWVEDLPDLPPGADPLLRARARALGRGGREDDAAELRRELGRIGVVVRDERRKQYIRVLPATD